MPFKEIGCNLGSVQFSTWTRDSGKELSLHRHDYFDKISKMSDGNLQFISSKKSFHGETK